MADEALLPSRGIKLARERFIESVNAPVLVVQRKHVIAGAATTGVLIGAVAVGAILASVVIHKHAQKHGHACPKLDN